MWTWDLLPHLHSSFLFLAGCGQELAPFVASDSFWASDTLVSHRWPGSYECVPCTEGLTCPVKSTVAARPDVAQPAARATRAPRGGRRSVTAWWYSQSLAERQPSCEASDLRLT